MKSFRTILLLPAALAGAFLISACTTWHTTGETVVGDPTIPHKSAELKSAPIRGTSAPAAPSTGNAAHASGSVSH